MRILLALLVLLIPAVVGCSAMSQGDLALVAQSRDAARQIAAIPDLPALAIQPISDIEANLSQLQKVHGEPKDPAMLTYSPKASIEAREQSENEHPWNFGFLGILSAILFGATQILKNILKHAKWLAPIVNAALPAVAPALSLLAPLILPVTDVQSVAAGGVTSIAAALLNRSGVAGVVGNFMDSALSRIKGGGLLAKILLDEPKGKK